MCCTDAKPWYNDSTLSSSVQVGGALLEGSDELRFEARDRAERYAWVGRTLVEQEYARLGPEAKGWCGAIWPR